jgi:hypothetical protein
MFDAAVMLNRCPNAYRAHIALGGCGPKPSGVSRGHVRDRKLAKVVGDAALKRFRYASLRYGFDPTVACHCRAHWPQWRRPRVSASLAVADCKHGLNANLYAFYTGRGNSLPPFYARLLTVAVIAMPIAWGIRLMDATYLILLIVLSAARIGFLLQCDRLGQRK